MSAALVLPVDEVNDGDRCCPICTDVYSIVVDADHDTAAAPGSTAAMDNSNTRPAALPCGHSICISCCKQILDGPKSGHCCPLCQHVFSSLPPPNYAWIDRNNYTQAIKKKMKQLNGMANGSTRNGASHFECRECSSSGQHIPAVTYCRQCRASLCEAHASQIHSMALFKDHVLVPATMMPSEEEERALCQIHPGLEVLFYCNSCKVVACHVCMVESHTGSGHSVVGLGTAAADVRIMLHERQEQAAASSNRVARMKQTLEQKQNDQCENNAAKGLRVNVTNTD